MKKITFLENYTDYHLGFEVQSPEPKFFSWDATYEEVIASPWVEQIHYQNYGDGVFGCTYVFRYPVRVGNLLFYNFEFGFTSTQRTDIAVREYRFESEKGASKHDFWQICQQLQQDLPPEKADEYLQNLYYSTHKEQMGFRMQYCGESQHRDILFTIHNGRDYMEKVKSHDNETDIELTDYLLFDKEKIRIYKDYRTSIAVKRRPPLLSEKFGNQAVLWRDEKHNEIGISEGKFCNLFPLSQIEKVYIERMLPAKGHGADYIFIQYKNEEYPTKILEADNNLFDEVDLEKIFKQKILFGGEYYNC